MRTKKKNAGAIVARKKAELENRIAQAKQFKKELDIAYDAYLIFQQCALLVLRDKFGFGAKRMDTFRAEMWYLIEAINSGHLSPTDIEETILDEVYKGVDPKSVTDLLKEKDDVMKTMLKTVEL